MQGNVLLLSLLVALGAGTPGEVRAVPSALAEPAAARRVYPGFGVLTPGAPARLPATLTKPLFRNGRLDPGSFVVHFRSPVTAADEARLDELTSAERRWVIPGDARVVWVADATTWLALRRWPRTDWVGRYEPAYKLDPALVNEGDDERPLVLDVDLAPGCAAAGVIGEIEALGACVRDQVRHRAHRRDGPCSLVVEATSLELPRLAWIEGIRTLQEHVEADPLSIDGCTAARDLATPSERGWLDRGPASQKLVVPTTLTLAPTAGRNSKNGPLSAADLSLLRSSDDARLNLRDREQLALVFDRTVPAEATVVALRVFVEHFEEPRVIAGDILWRLGRGALDAPVVVESSVAPLRTGVGLETVDLWTPRALLPDPNALVVQIQNDDQDDDTVLDRVFVEVDYVLPDATPAITSTPNATAIVGQAYAYDADGRAEASGAATIAWSVASGPAGFAIDATTGLVSWTPSAAGAFALTLRATNAAGEATQSFVVQASVAPLPTTLLPSNTTVVTYCPSERLALGPAATQQRVNVFLPMGTPPPGGWPVVLNTRAGGGFPFTPLGSLSSTGGTAPLHAFVASNVAVVDYGVTGIGSGLGLFYPPGHPSGRYESFGPQDDNPEKEAEWAVQWVKTQSDFPLDGSRICIRGSSQGAIIGIWAAMGPERSRVIGPAQFRTNSRVKGVLALQPPSSMWAFDQTPALASRMIGHFEQQGLPGVAATELSQVAKSLQEDGSIMRFAFETDSARTHNEAQAICLLYNDPVKHVGGVPADMTLDATGFPRLHDTLARPFIHDSWSGYVFYKHLIGLSPQSAAFHAQHSVFAMRDTNALPPPLDFHTRTYSGAITGTQAIDLAHAWVLQTLGVD